MDSDAAAGTNPATRETVIFILVLVAGMAVYLFNLNYSDIWIDESLSKALVRHSLSDVVRLVAHDSHPPLYFVGLKLFTAVAGNLDFTIRLFSVLGALALLATGFMLGRRVFGPRGALYLSVLLLALPMPGLYSHIARMYTWAAFLVLGVFLTAVRYARDSRTSDLVWLGLFSLMAAYIHYYSLIAAFWMDLSLLVCLIAGRNPAWRRVAAMGVAVFLLYLPWLFVFLAQAATVHGDFWIPPVSWGTVLACYMQPFGGLFRLLDLSWVLMVVYYGLTLAAVGITLRSPGNGHRLPLALALVGFHATVATAIVASLCFRPILYPRYITTIAPLLVVPPVLALLRWRPRWPGMVLLTGSLACGLFVVIFESSFSYGPYQQALHSLSEAHPEAGKIVHLNEVTAGPLAEYGRGGPWSQYYLNNEGTSWYSNMDAFEGLESIHSVREVVKAGEVFCLVEFAGLPLNRANLDLVIAQCEVIAVEDVVDEKPYSGVLLKLHILKDR